VKPSVEVTPINDDISDAIAGFFCKVWTDNATGERVRGPRAEAARVNPALPGADVPAVVYLRDAEVIGHLEPSP
jgi:hypothetical protein